jgi:hypothetical protein
VPAYFIGNRVSNDRSFYLFELDDDTLNFILELRETELDRYIHALICRFYYKHLKNDDYYNKLVKAYKSSFILEKLYRVNSSFNKNYTAIYTKTGLIREIVSDLYHIGTEKTSVN